ncbi:MAG: ComEC/Rec2 family competence protein, partial [Pseudomonadota bacterium]
AALMTGERAAIYEEDWQALRVSGLAHIISISGLHVAMVAGPVFFLVRFFLALIPFLALHYPIKKIAAACALLVACLYVGLVVPSVPTTRSLLMTAIMLIAVMLDRSPISMRLVAVSAIIVLIFQPESIWSASFQMSFAAVAALVAVAEALAPFWSSAYGQASWFKRAGLWVMGALLTSLVAALATAPFSLYHFGQLATYSVFANFVSIPLSGLIIMPMLMVSFILMPFGLDMWSLQLMGKGVEWLLDVARATENLPYAQLSIAAAPVSFLVWSSVAGILLLFLHGRVRLISIVPALVSFYCLMSATQPVMLVSEDGGVMALHDKKNMIVSSTKKSKFVTESWRKYLGVTVDNVLEFPREGMWQNINCGGGLCRMVVTGQKITYGDKLYELHQDCSWADILITPQRAGYNFCKNKNILIVDYYALKQKGAMAFYVGDDGGRLTLKTVAEERGKRPWSEQHRTYHAFQKTKAIGTDVP